ncbi:MAG: serine hydroxymethyltransferase, partial [Planctomycetaceae bacterium]
MLCDVTSIGQTGKIAEKALDLAGITVNKNMIPFDKRKPMDPSGVRIGTAALTTRGMKEDEMKRVGAWILEVLAAPEDESVTSKVKGEISAFAADYPVPGLG